MSDKQKLKKYFKKYYKINKERMNSQMKEYYEKNKKNIRKKNKEWYIKNKNKIQKYREIYRKKNKDKLNEWYLNNKIKLLKKQKEYRKIPKVKEKIKEKAKKYREKNKEKVFNYYGKVCNWCGESDKKVLIMDHINNDGVEHRKEIGFRKDIYGWLIKNNFPEGFQTLCWNCNSGLKTKGFTKEEVQNRILYGGDK